MRWNPFYQMVLDIIVVSYAYWMIVVPLLLIGLMTLHATGLWVP